MPVEVMRSFEETFGCIVLEGYGLCETSPVASFNHPHAERKPGSIGTPIRGVRDAPGRRRRQRRRRRRGRRDRDPRRERHEGLLAAAGGHGEGDPRRLVPHRRPRPAGRRRLLLHRRPEEGDDHPRRLQRVPAGDRGSALRAPGGRRGRVHRDQPPRPRRGGRRRRRAQARRVRPSPRSCRRSSRSGSRPTSTRATSGSSTPCRRGRPARSCGGPSRCPGEVGSR